MNVFDLQKSLAFYDKALGLKEHRRKEAPDGSFILVYLSDGATPFELELTWLRDRTEPYNLGDNEIHLAVRVEDKAAAHALHEEMGCICLKTARWTSISSTTPTATGLKSWTANPTETGNVCLAWGRHFFFQASQGKLQRAAPSKSIVRKDDP